MKRLLFLLFLSACATGGPLNAPATPPPTIAATDGAGNRLEALAPRGAQSCSSDGAWCVSDDGAVTGPDHVQRVAVTNLNGNEEEHAWPFIVRMPGADNAALIGLTYRRTDMYSGGGAAETWLTLYAVSPGDDKTTPMASMMLEGSATIRACFDEQDRRTRRNACADQYDFTGAPNLITENTDRWPRLRFISEAWTYPGRISRSEDSTMAAPLKASDIIWVRDDTCSYQRTFAYANGRYAPDAPVPDCTDYRTQ